MSLRSAPAFFLPGHDLHHLDHLAPLAALLDIPLFVTSEEIENLAHSFYLSLRCQYLEPLEAAHYLATHHDLIFSCLPRPLLAPHLFHERRTQLSTVWVPHGQSDKGWHRPYFEALGEETSLLIYGPHMRATLAAKGISSSEQIEVGAYRFLYFEQHRAWYESLVQQEIRGRLAPAPLSVLYAPTWRDAEENCSISEGLPPLLERLPEGVNLVVQLHPNLLRKEPASLLRWRELYSDHPHILFLEHFPTIHPLLSWADVYLGDGSSVGYDFLLWDRPLLFLNQQERNPQDDPAAQLMQTGLALPPAEYPHIYTHLTRYLQEPSAEHAAARKAFATHTFGASRPLSELQRSLRTALSLETL